MIKVALGGLFLLLMGFFMIEGFEIGDPAIDCIDGEYAIVQGGIWECTNSTNAILSCLQNHDCTIADLTVTGDLTIYGDITNTTVQQINTTLLEASQITVLDNLSSPDIFVDRIFARNGTDLSILLNNQDVLTFNGSGAQNKIKMFPNAGDGLFVINSLDEPTYSFEVFGNNNNIMRIFGTVADYLNVRSVAGQGKVGINTLEPVNALQVKGTS